MVAGDTTRVGSTEEGFLPLEDRFMCVFAFIGFDCPCFIMASANDCRFPEDFRATDFVAAPPALVGFYRDCSEKVGKTLIAETYLPAALQPLVGLWRTTASFQKIFAQHAL